MEYNKYELIHRMYVRDRNGRFASTGFGSSMMRGKNKTSKKVNDNIDDVDNVNGKGNKSGSIAKEKIPQKYNPENANKPLPKGFDPNDLFDAFELINTGYKLPKDSLFADMLNNAHGDNKRQPLRKGAKDLDEYDVLDDVHNGKIGKITKEAIQESYGHIKGLSVDNIYKATLDNMSADEASWLSEDISSGRTRDLSKESIKKRYPYLDDESIDYVVGSYSKRELDTIKNTEAYKVNSTKPEAVSPYKEMADNYEKGTPKKTKGGYDPNNPDDAKELERMGIKIPKEKIPQKYNPENANKPLPRGFDPNNMFDAFELINTGYKLPEDSLFADMLNNAHGDYKKKK